MFDGKAFGEQMVEVVRSYFDEATTPLIRRIAELEARGPAKDGVDGKDGQDGRDGQDAQPVTEEQIADAVARHMAANPPAAGKDGEDGQSADMDALKAHCAELVKALPTPEKGKDGQDGQSADMDALKAHCAALVDALPKAKDGQDGRDGTDGIGLAGAMIDRDGALNVTLSNGEVRKLGPVVGRDGQDGEHGKRGEAGFSLTDFETEWRPEDKVLVLRWTAGETTYSHELLVPYVRDQGVWTEGKEYLPGDGVTWGGSFWIAQEDTSAKPEAGRSWRLAVKRGRDGKDFAGPQARPAETVKI